MALPTIQGILKNVSSSAAGGFFKGLSDLAKDFIIDPTKKAEFLSKAEELHTSIQLKQIDEQIAQINANKEGIIAVNTTMQSESKSEHFLVWSWRPLVGYSFIAYIFNNYVLLPYLQKYGIVKIEMDPTTMMAIGAVLGIASWGRSQKSINNSK